MVNCISLNHIPFEVTNRVACFQRVIDQIISDENHTGLYAYLDDITVCRVDKSDHDRNLNKLMAVLEKEWYFSFCALRPRIEKIPFMSKEVKKFHNENRVATSGTTLYNPWEQTKCALYYEVENL